MIEFLVKKTVFSSIYLFVYDKIKYR